jgi:ribosomal-protein-alanine N-acetyltransferase
MEIQLTTCRLALWREEFAEEIARQGNNPNIKRYLREAFPSPYRLEHAKEFIARGIKGEDGVYRCILVEGKPAGSISFRPRADIERFSAELGYWLGEEYWGRSIAPEAIRGMTEMAIMYHGLHRLFALIDEGNHGSMRACEKAGYTFEARLKEAVFKRGKFLDQMVYAYVAADNPA